MTEINGIFEKHVFFSTAKNKTVYMTVLEKVFSLPIAGIAVDYSDRPSEHFSTLNDRTKKILLNLAHPEKINKISGDFTHGGTFELIGGALEFSVDSDNYNYEIIDSLKEFLSPVFPLSIFQNPYIWGVTLYDSYEREHFFNSRKYAARSTHLEEPEIDVFRRDDGIIFKLRFHLKDEPEMDVGIKMLAPLFENFLDALKKRAYEGMEILHIYCTDMRAFRNLEPRTKMGKEIKTILKDH